MNILLISADDRISSILTVLQQILISKGHTCKYVYLHVPEHKYEESYIKNIAQQIINLEKNAKLIGFSCMTCSFLFNKEIAKEIKKKSEGKIIFGGIHPTVKPEEVLEFADYVCVGEGEEAIIELAEALENNKKTDNIKNIYTKVNGKIITNEIRPLVTNLSFFPIPRYDSKELYIYYKGTIYNLNEKRELFKILFPDVYHLFGARGCPYRCNYCVNGALFALKKEYLTLRRRSNEHIIEELKTLRQLYFNKIKIAIVEDDFCAQSEKNMEEFLNYYKKEINLPFSVCSTPTSITEKKMELLVNAGLNTIVFGIQSINDNVNKEIYSRFATKNTVIKAVEIVKKYRHNIQIVYDLILDNPWEKNDAKIETLRFLYSIPKPVTINLYSLTFYPGTPLYTRGKKEGLIKNELDEIYKKSYYKNINSNSINTLFILYVRYHFPKLLIEIGLKMRRNRLLDYIMAKSTIPLCRIEYKIRDIVRFIKLFIIAVKNKEDIKYYITLPFDRIFHRQ